MIESRICPDCGAAFSGTHWHETGACLIELRRVVADLRAQVQTHQLASATWRQRYRDAIGATDDSE